MTVAVTAVTEGQVGQAVYEVGDIVLVGALEEGKKYLMYSDPDVSNNYVDGMVSNQIATIAELLHDDECRIYGYLLDEDKRCFTYTDEMIIGKVVKIDDLDALVGGDTLLITSDDTIGINPSVLGKVVTFDKVLKRKGEAGQGMMSLLDLDEELISINVEGVRLTISPEYIEGVVYNPFEHFCELMEELTETCNELKAEVGEEELEGILSQIMAIALVETVKEITGEVTAEGVAEELIRAIFGDEIEEGIEDCACGADVTGHAWKEQAEQLTKELDEKESEAEMKVDLNVGTHVIETDALDCNSLMTYNIHVEKIIHQNPATIVFYRTGAYDENHNFYVPEGSKLRKCVAKAHDGDVYDAQKGFAICMYKIFNRESAKRLKELAK